MFGACRRGIVSFHEVNSIEVWKQRDECFYYVPIEYLCYTISGIHAVQVV